MEFLASYKSVADPVLSDSPCRTCFSIVWHLLAADLHRSNLIASFCSGCCLVVHTRHICYIKLALLSALPLHATFITHIIYQIFGTFHECHYSPHIILSITWDMPSPTGYAHKLARFLVLRIQSLQLQPANGTPCPPKLPALVQLDQDVAFLPPTSDLITTP